MPKRSIQKQLDEEKRDASIHRAYELTSGQLPRLRPVAPVLEDTSETGFQKILDNLRRLTGFVPPEEGKGQERKG